MIKFINRVTGTDMWVPDNRVDEYVKAGHKPAFALVPEKKPVKAAKKTTKK